VWVCGEGKEGVKIIRKRVEDPPLPTYLHSSILPSVRLASSRSLAGLLQKIQWSIYLPIYLSIYLSIYLPTYLPIYLYIYLPIYLPTYLPTYLPIHID
jgi:hypothetical protein